MWLAPTQIGGTDMRKHTTMRLSAAEREMLELLREADVEVRLIEERASEAHRRRHRARLRGHLLAVPPGPWPSGSTSRSGVSLTAAAPDKGNPPGGRAAQKTLRSRGKPDTPG